MSVSTPLPPLVLPALCLAAGILAAPRVDTTWAVGPLLLIAILARARPGLVLPGIALLGAFLSNRDAAQARIPRLPDDGLPSRVTARLVSPPVARDQSSQLQVQILSVDGRPIPSGKALLSWFPDGYGSGEIFDALALGRGDLIRVLVELRRPHGYRNPGVFDYSRYLERKGVYWVGTIRSPRLIGVLDRGWHGLDQARGWIAGRIGRYFHNPTTRSIILGMVLGQRRLLPPADARSFEDAGLIHLLVVSGFNLAVVALVAFRIGQWLPMGRYRRVGSRIFALLLIGAYAVVVEGDAPVVRATLMACLLLAGTALDRGYSVGNALAGTALLILLLDPGALRDSSFLLSFGAVLAILLVGGPAVSWMGARTRNALRQLPDVQLDRGLEDDVTDLRVRIRIRAELGGYPVSWIAAPLRLGLLLMEVTLVTASIQALLLPFAIESFHRLAPVAVPLNVVGAIVAAVTTPAGLLLIFLPEAAGAWVAAIPGLLVDLLSTSVGWSLNLPGATVRVPSVPPFLWLVYGSALIWVAFQVRHRHPRRAAFGLSMALAAGLLMALGDFSPPPPVHPVLTFLDVGQGDSAVLETPDGQVWVVDGGGKVSGDPEPGGGFRIGEDVVSGYLFSRRFRRIDVLVLTHAHHDHMDGLFDLIRNFRIGEVWLGPNPLTPRYRQLIQDLGRRNIPLRQVRAGDVSGLVEVLAPEPGRLAGREVRNDDSLVLLVRWHGRTAMLTGDLESDLENPIERVDILKIPHHGSSNTHLSTHSAVPVISVGANNRFGHPSPNRLPALRTDLLGAVRVSLTPAGPEVSFPGL